MRLSPRFVKLHGAAHIITTADSLKSRSAVSYDLQSRMQVTRDFLRLESTPRSSHWISTVLNDRMLLVPTRCSNQSSMCKPGYAKYWMLDNEKSAAVALIPSSVRLRINENGNSSQTECSSFCTKFRSRKLQRKRTDCWTYAGKRDDFEQRDEVASNWKVRFRC